MTDTAKVASKEIGSLCQAFIRDIETLADTLPFIINVLGK